MLAVVVLTLGLQLAVIYVPWLQAMFQTQGLSQQEVLISLAISTLGLWVVEVQKLFLRLRAAPTRSASHPL